MIHDSIHSFIHTGLSTLKRQVSFVQLLPTTPMTCYFSHRPFACFMQRNCF